jgi:drug/metabolite transporter (DMT)-like permease
LSGATQILSDLPILNATTPLFGVLVAHFFTSDEKMSGKKLAGALIGFTGVAIMMGPSALSGLGSHIWAQLAILLASVFYAISGVYGRRFKQMGVTPMMTATGQLTASMMLTPVALLADHSWTLTNPALRPPLRACHSSTALAYLIFFFALAHRRDQPDAGHLFSFRSARFCGFVVSGNNRGHILSAWPALSSSAIDL